MAWEILVVLGAVALILLVAYLLYSTAFRAFEAVGFTRAQAFALLLGTFFLSFVDIPIWVTANGWLLAVNVGGAVVPVVISLWLLSRYPSATLEAMVAVTLTALVTFLIVSPTPEGISAPLHFALLPPATAAAVSILAHWRHESYAAPIAFIGGALGSIIGADVLRLPEFLAQSPPADSAGIASIGGAGVWDMVFLSAIVAVGLDLLFFHRIRRERGDMHGWAESEVFTTSTPAEMIRDWRAPATLEPQDRGEQALAAAQERRALYAAKLRQPPGR